MKGLPFYAAPGQLSKKPEYRRLRLSHWELHSGFLSLFKVNWILHCSSPLREAILKAGPNGSIVAIVSFQNHIDGSRHAVAQIPLSTMKRLEANGDI